MATNSTRRPSKQDLLERIQYGLGTMKFSHSKYTAKQINTGIRDILSRADLMTAAVISEGTPHTFTAYYAYNDANGEFHLYFMSDPSTMHGTAIGKCSHLALAIYVQTTAWGQDLQGIQAEGEVRLLSEEQSGEAIRAYGNRFAPFGAAFTTMSELVAAGNPSRPYRITLTRMNLTNELRFDRREVISSSPNVKER